MNTIIVVAGPVIIENEKVLLVQHGDTDFWKFCGGKFETSDNTLVETVRREAKEEMGIGIEIINQCAFTLHIVKETSEGQVDVFLSHFLSKRIGEIVPGSEIRKWQWLSLDELASENLAPNILPTLHHFGFIK